MRGAAKPISTLIHPLPSIDYATRERSIAHVERSDVCVVPAAASSARRWSRSCWPTRMRVKFGGDSLEEALANFRGYAHVERETATIDG